MSGAFHGNFSTTVETELPPEPLKKTQHYVDSLNNVSLESFESIAENMIPLTEDRGVLKQKIKDAPENSKSIGESDYVWINYTGYLEGCDEPFDSTYLRNSAWKTKLSNRNLILGFQIALKTMKVGEISRYIFAPQYAFFGDDLTPRIPSHSFVMFEIQIMKSLPANEFHSYFDIDREERMKYDLQTILRIIQNDKERANNYYKEKLFARAINVYKECLQITEEHLSPSNLDNIDFKKSRIDLLNNIATANFKLNSFTNAEKYSRLVFKLDSNNLKAHIVYIRTLISVSRLEDAKIQISEALKLFPQNEKLKECMIFYANAKNDLEAQRKNFSRAFLNIKDLDGIELSNLHVSESFESSVLESIEFLLQNESRNTHTIQYPNLKPNEIKFFELKAKEAGLYFCLNHETNGVVINLYK